ncbi:hypothetical protein B0H66DRAFT_537672 [Apodospora peruviana]|uniref:Uncharacterized protein n=1 Tax=Apodospora peruviana TaxID=516989 RepID=A0AAE0LYR2_9PEZI|nr:hypothetical protein B0H66DRAFT_537672 [Apodospora peruviana]
MRALVGCRVWPPSWDDSSLESFKPEFYITRPSHSCRNFYIPIPLILAGIFTSPSLSFLQEFLHPHPSHSCRNFYIPIPPISTGVLHHPSLSFLYELLHPPSPGAFTTASIPQRHPVYMERPTETTEKVWDTWQKLVKHAGKLKILGSLNTSEVKQGKDASEVLLAVQTVPRRQIYKLFLHDVLSHSGPAVVLLCAIAAGQTRIANLKTIDRTQLSNLIRSKLDAINHPVIGRLAKECQIPSSVDDIPLPAVDSQSNKRSKKRARSLETANLGPEIEESGQRVDNNATLRGINGVFNKYICDAIRRVTDQDEVKAAVTMILPLWGGPVDCFVSLDICENEVEKLSMALFKAKVRWAEHTLRLEREGIVVSIPSSEATIGGVLDGDILEVFGPVVHTAITENPVRKRELEEGKLATECVSMGFIKNGAILNLSLGLERGLEIWKELYT